jgi:hypothetical protein
MAHKLVRLKEALQAKGPEESALYLVESLLSDMEGASGDSASMREVLHSYQNYKHNLVAAIFQQQGAPEKSKEPILNVPLQTPQTLVGATLGKK